MNTCIFSCKYAVGATIACVWVVWPFDYAYFRKPSKGYQLVFDNYNNLEL